MPFTRIARSAAAVLVAALPLATFAGIADASPRAAAKHVVGGPLLARHGVVEQPLPGAPALPPHLPSSSWMITDLTTGQVLAAKNAHGKFLPASTLKTLTAATLLPRLKPSNKFTVTYKDATVDGTRAGLVDGHRYTIHKLFQAMLIDSANDAADALAQANGGMQKTLRQMNAEAHHLQADDTHADTPSGLDGPGETSSAYDLALIAQHDFAIPAFRHYVQTIHTEIPAPHHKHFQIYTHNNLLTTDPYRGDIGGKNGYTVAAEATYVGAATHHGQTMLVTLMHAYPYWWFEAKSLLQWGFKAQHKVTPVGHLVQPLQPAPAKPASIHQATLATGPDLAAAPTAHNHDTDIALAALVATLLAVAGVFGVRRRGGRRRRLTLPTH